MMIFIVCLKSVLRSSNSACVLSDLAQHDGMTTCHMMRTCFMRVSVSMEESRNHKISAIIILLNLGLTDHVNSCQREDITVQTLPNFYLIQQHKHFFVSKTS